MAHITERLRSETIIDPHTGLALLNNPDGPEAADLIDALSTIIANAALIPDPATGESTDCYAVPIDDIRAAEAAFAKARGEQVSA